MDTVAQHWFQLYCEQRRGELRQSSRTVYGAWWSCFSSYVGEKRCALCDVPTNMAEAFLRQYAHNTAIRYYRLISSVYDTALEHDLCSHNPLAALQKIFDKKEDRVPVAGASGSAVTALYGIKPVGSWKKSRDRVLVLLAAETGLRRSELLNLQIANLRLDGVVPYVSVGAGVLARRVEMPAEAATELKQWLIDRTALNIQGDLVFPTNVAGGPLNPATAYRIIERYMDKIGAGKQALGSSGTQVLRAGLAHRNKADGHKLPVIQEQLGHRRLLSTADLLARVTPSRED
jgi:integrase